MLDFSSSERTKAEIDGSTYILFKDVPIIRAGVFQYLGREIHNSLEPNKYYRVLRSVDMLTNAETISKFELKPLIEGHTKLGRFATPPEEKGVGGVIANVRADNGQLIADVKVFSIAMQEDIDEGKRGLSTGMECLYNLENGIYNGESYDAVQTIIAVNHIALTARERDTGKTVIKQPEYILTNDEESNEGDRLMEGFTEEQERKIIELVESIVARLLEEKAVTNDSQDEDGEKIETPEEALDDAVTALEQIVDVAQDAKEEIKESVETNDSISTISLKAMHEFDSLYKSTSALFGKFDRHKFSSIKDLSKYALKKLDIPIQKGAEVMQAKTALAVALRNKAPQERLRITNDSEPNRCLDFVDAREKLKRLKKV